MTELVGILLAGGMSRRFGSPKAFAEIENDLFYERAYRALDQVCDHVVIISRPELVAHFPAEYDVITDLKWVAGQGPLAGILTGMSARTAEKYVVLPCDMPFIGKAEMAKLLALADPLFDITAVHNAAEKIPLFSIWSYRAKEPLHNDLVAGQLRVMKLMEKLTTQWIDSSLIHKDPLVFRNINQPDY